jgi:hypothetical protein
MVVVLGVTVALAWLLLPQRAAAGPLRQERDLWFAIRLTPELVEWFNRTAGPQDIALVPPEAGDWVAQIAAGKIQVTFSSAAEAEATVPSLAGRIDIVGYELVHLPSTPVEDQEDPLAALGRVHAVAEAHGLDTALRMDRRFAESHGAQLCRYVDLVVLQGQRLQGDPQAMEGVMRPLIDALRSARPDLEIGIQLRCQEDLLPACVAAQCIEDCVQGVSVLYSSATIEAAQAFVEQIAGGHLEAQIAPTPAEEQPAATPSPTAEASPSPEPVELPLTPRRAPLVQCTWPAGLVLAGSGWVVARARRRRP